MADQALAAPGWLGRRSKPSSLDRAPALVDAMSRVSDAWATQFVALSGTQAEMRCTGVRLGTVGQVLKAHGAAPICALLGAPEWSASVGIVLDRALATVLVEALFGGDGGETDAPPPAGLSPIECQIVDLFGQQLAEAVPAGLAPDVRFALRYEHRLAKPEFGALGKGEQPVGVIGLTVSALGRSCDIDLLLPQTVLDSVIDGLETEAEHVPAEHDPRWSRQLGDEVGRAMTSLQATVELPPMSLGAILGLRPGQILTFAPAAASKVRLSCGANPLFQCELGQVAGHYTVRIDDVLANGPAKPSILTAS